MEHISVVIMNWNRAFNLRYIILPILSRHKLINEIIISHGKVETQFSYNNPHCEIIHRDDSSLNNEYGLSRRFLAAQQAKNDTVIIMDDDLLPFFSTISTLFNHYNTNPNCIHGIYGRNIDTSLRYNYKNQYGSVHILLTRLLIMNKRKCTDFFNYLKVIDQSVLDKGKPYWNGEDLFLSLVSLKSENSLNKSYRLPVIDLYYSSLFGISNTMFNLFKNNKDLTLPHKQYRSYFIKHAIDKLELNLKSVN